MRKWPSVKNDSTERTSMIVINILNLEDNYLVV
jgi:hypothetical protein